ncbi:MAG: tetratricopeptide repeat protein, partial [Bacteroidota bacterium]
MKRHIFIIALLLPVLALAQENQTIRAFKAEKLYVRGLEQYQNGDIRGAIQTFDQVISLDRNHGQVYQAKGDALYELGDFDEAIESYNIAAQQYPDNANIRNSLGVAAGQMGMYRAAESYFLEALQIDPNLASAKRNLERAQIKIREGST